VAGTQVVIVGAVLGVLATSAPQSELGGVISAAENLGLWQAVPLRWSPAGSCWVLAVREGHDARLQGQECHGQRRGNLGMMVW